MARRATTLEASCCPDTDGLLRVSGGDSGSGNGRSIARLSFTQPCLHPSGAGAAQSVGGLIAGQQNQRGLAVAVVECPFQGREELEQLSAQPVDRSGSVSDQVATTSGEEAQVDCDLVTRSQGLKVAAHPGLIGDHRRVFGVSFPVAAVSARGVINGAARDVEEPLLGGEEQRDHQCGPTVVEVDRPGDLTAVCQCRDGLHQLQQGGLVVGDALR